METNVILYESNQLSSTPKTSAKHIHEFDAYLKKLGENKTIDSHQVVFLKRRPDDAVNGFFWIHGSSEQLRSVYSSSEWQKLVTQTPVYLEGFGIIGGVIGELVMNRMDRRHRRIL